MLRTTARWTLVVVSFLVAYVLGRALVIWGCRWLWLIDSDLVDAVVFHQPHEHQILGPIVAGCLGMVPAGLSVLAASTFAPSHSKATALVAAMLAFGFAMANAAIGFTYGAYVTDSLAHVVFAGAGAIVSSKDAWSIIPRQDGEESPAPVQEH